MRRCGISIRWLVLAAVLAAAPVAVAQQSPRIGYVYPAGGTTGATIEVTVGGQYLDGVAEGYFSGQGLTAKVVEHQKPIQQQQIKDWRDKLQELRKKKPIDDATEKEIADLTMKIAKAIVRPAAPAIAETVTLEVAVAADASPGRHELRLATPMGLSNPLAFFVDRLPEFSKKPSTVPEDISKPRPMRRRDEPRGGPPEPPKDVTLPTIINGQIMPGGADRYQFKASKSQRLVVAVRARELIPYIADAVPGWFQAAVTLYDSSGKEVAFADHFRFNQDPVFCCEIPQDGQYTLEVHDTLYRGRDDFVYRITVGEVPYITDIFPLGCQAGQQCKVQIKGWNLHETATTFDARQKLPGVYSISASGDTLNLNSVQFAVDDRPECAQIGGNHAIATAQNLTMPVIVNGRIDQPGQWDVYSFSGKAGQEVVCEVTARRLGSPMDSILKVTNVDGKELAINDDQEDRSAGLITHHADSYTRLKLPADGNYFVHVSDLQRQDGDCAYRLRVSEPRPDFELRLFPSNLNIRTGLSSLITVQALRKDGFAGDIGIVWNDIPDGFKLSSGKIAAGQDQVRLTVTAPRIPLTEPIHASLQGKAKIDGREIIRPAVPAEEMMQAFAYKHLVIAQDLNVAVSGRPVRPGARILTPMPLKLPVGKPVSLRVELPTVTFLGDIQLELSDPPAGVSIEKVSAIQAGTEITLQTDASKLSPGAKGNLIVSVSLVREMPNKRQRRVPLGTLEAVPFEIVEP